MRADEKAEVIEEAAHFMQLVSACRVLGDMQILRIRQSSENDLLDAMEVARSINKGIR